MSVPFKLTGSIVAGPSAAGAVDGSFPTMSAEATLGTKQTGFAASTGTLRKSLASPGSFVALSGLGAAAGDAVNLGKFLYIRTDAKVELRLSQKDPGGGADIVKVVPIEGLNLQEFPSSDGLTLLEAQGSATIEYMICGD